MALRLNKKSTKPKIWSLTDIKGFGEKYRCDTIKEIIEEDAKHVEWLLANLEWFILDNEAFKFYEECVGHYCDNLDPDPDNLYCGFSGYPDNY